VFVFGKQILIRLVPMDDISLRKLCQPRMLLSSDSYEPLRIRPELWRFDREDGQLCIADTSDI
jgi:hypothetical protein